MGGVGYVATTDRPARRDPPDRADAAAAVRRVRRLAFGARRGAARGLPRRRHQGRAVGRHRCARSGRSSSSSSALSGTTTTMRKPIGPIRENAQTRAFLRDVMREVVAVGRAHGVEPARGLRRRAPEARRRRRLRHDLVDAPRPRARQPARGALARRRRWSSSAAPRAWRRR